jgi:7-keto-8-aminopelargonate synthetase-like enzyme
MNGVVVNLPELVTLAKKYQARLYIDDAHALGVIGKHGRGTGEHFNLESDVDLLMGTFSKSLASIGGFIAGPKKVISWIKHKSRSLIFSASIPPASVAVALKCLEILQREPQLRQRLLRNTERARIGLKKIGYQVGEGGAAIVPVSMNGDRDFTLTFAQALFDKGLFSTPILPPAVPQGTTSIRTSYMASHTDEDIDQVIEIFKQVGEQFGVLGEKNATVRSHVA